MGLFFFIVFLVGLHKLFKNSQACRKKVQIAEAVKDFPVLFLIHGKRTTCFNLSFFKICLNLELGGKKITLENTVVHLDI